MRQAEVYRNNVFAGILTENDEQKYIFRYNDKYFFDKKQPSISLTLPKIQQEYTSDLLFPFFFNMIAEGVNRQLQSAQLKISENDDFGLLIATSKYDTIGAITLKIIDNL